MRINVILLAFCLAGCTSAIQQKNHTSGPERIAWPPPPAPAKIVLQAVFSNAEELGYKESFTRRLGKFFAGAEERNMKRPYAVAVSDTLIAVADPGASVVHLFDKNRKSYRVLKNVGDNELVSPIGVALGNNRLFIADSILNKVFVLENDLTLLYVLDDFERPTSLAFDTRGNQLFVADTLAHQVKSFDNNGNTLYSIGSRGETDGEFNYPTHLAFSGNRLYVNDTMNFRIQIFNSDGQYISSLGSHGSAAGHFTQSKGVAVDSDGHVYVADALKNSIQVFDQNGEFLLSFGVEGNSPGAFRMPAGVAIWDDKIYVTDSYNHRVQVFQYLNEVR